MSRLGTCDQLGFGKPKPENTELLLSTLRGLTRLVGRQFHHFAVAPDGSCWFGINHGCASSKSSWMLALQSLWVLIENEQSITLLRERGFRDRERRWWLAAGSGRRFWNQGIAEWTRDRQVSSGISLHCADRSRILRDQRIGCKERDALDSGLSH
jgi:hypothetical protein